MKWIVGHVLEFTLIVIYIRYYNVVDFLQWDVKSTLELDYMGVNTPKGPSSPHSKLIYHDDMVYENWITSKFTLMHKGVLAIMQGCTRILKKVFKLC